MACQLRCRIACTVYMLDMILYNAYAYDNIIMRNCHADRCNKFNTTKLKDVGSGITSKNHKPELQLCIRQQLAPTRCRNRERNWMPPHERQKFIENFQCSACSSIRAYS